MPQFLGDIAFLLELGLVASGLVLLHVGGIQSARLIRAAGWTLVVGATATALCTVWFWVRYYQDGDFDRAATRLMLEEHAPIVDSAGIDLRA